MQLLLTKTHWKCCVRCASICVLKNIQFKWKCWKIRYGLSDKHAIHSNVQIGHMTAYIFVLFSVLGISFVLLMLLLVSSHLRNFNLWTLFCRVVMSNNSFNFSATCFFLFRSVSDTNWTDQIETCAFIFVVVKIC